MSHFALVNAKGIVEQVIVAEQDVIDTGLFGNPSSWVQTSYNTHGGVHTNGGTPLRKNFAGIGYTYDPIRDAFIPPKPWASWVLNEERCRWEAPIPRPDDTYNWIWDEPTLSWVENTSGANIVEEIVAEPVVSEPISEIVITTSSNDTITMGTANDTISL